MTEERNWWENYSPIPREQIPMTLRSTLTPSEVIVATSKISGLAYFRLIFGHSLGLLIVVLFGVILQITYGIEGIAMTLGSVIFGILVFGIPFLVRLSILRRSMIIITDQRFLGSFGVKAFSTDKMDIPLRSVDSFGVDDSFFGNIFGYTKVRVMSRSSTHSFKWITRESCQSIKDAYYGWDAKQSKDR